MADKGTILVIDDSVTVLARTEAALAEAGYRVVTTTQTVGAGRYLKGCDLVLLDFHMPGIDGGDVLRSLKAAARAMEKIPLFYLYTSDEEVAQRHASLGSDGVFKSKGDEAALVPQVEAAFRLARLKALRR